MMSDSGQSTQWSVLAAGNWESRDDIVVLLDSALGELDGVEGDYVLHDYVDVEAMIALFRSRKCNDGVQSLQFRCGHQVIRVNADGTIEARPRYDR